MTKQEALYLSIGQELVEAQESQMFGKPCFKIGGKAFVVFFQDAMVFKLTGKKHSEALAYDGAQLFDPSGKGRLMKEWVQVPYDFKDDWEELAQEAMSYVIEKYKVSL